MIAQSTKYIHLAGNISITSLNYETRTQTVVCTSTGGPATTFTWSKDSSSIVDDTRGYELSKIIINRTSATYESRLMIVEKSSKLAGNYTCMVCNSRGSTQKSLHLEGKILVRYKLWIQYYNVVSRRPLPYSVCSDMEVRFSNGDSRNVEVCIDDQWHTLVNSAIVIKTTPWNITTENNSTSVIIIWSLSNDLSVNNYDISCKTINSGQTFSVKVANVSASITMMLIDGLIPDTEYKCCITAHLLTSSLIDTITLSCITTRTLLLPFLDVSEICNSSDIIGLGTSLSVWLLLLLGTCVGCTFLLLVKQQRTSVRKHWEV